MKTKRTVTNEVEAKGEPTGITMTTRMVVIERRVLKPSLDSGYTLGQRIDSIIESMVASGGDAKPETITIDIPDEMWDEMRLAYHKYGKSELDDTF